MIKFMEYCRNVADIKGFPEKINTIKELARITAIMIWTLTGYHSISFAIEFIDTYIPFRPPCMQRPFPIDLKIDVSKEYITSSLPYPKKCEAALLLATAITLRSVPTFT